MYAFSLEGAARSYPEMLMPPGALGSFGAWVPGGNVVYGRRDTQ